MFKQLLNDERLRILYPILELGKLSNPAPNPASFWRSLALHLEFKPKAGFSSWVTG